MFSKTTSFQLPPAVRSWRLTTRWLAAATVISVTCLASLPASAITIHLQFVRMADDDGSHRAEITAAEAKSWVDGMNATHTANATGIQFSFNPTNSFTTIKNTLINRDTDTSGANEIARSFPGKIGLFVCWGPDEWPTGGGYTSGTGNYIFMPSYWVTANCNWGQNYGLITHEMGHHLGLGHSFWAQYDTRAQAESDLAANGWDANYWKTDMPDLGPIPMIGEYGCSGPATDVFDDLNDSIWPVNVDYHRSNVMGYYNWPTPTGGNFTPNQKTRISWASTYLSASSSLADGTSWHVRANRPSGGYPAGDRGAYDVDVLTVTQQSNAPRTYETITSSPWEPWWNWNDQLRIDFANGGSVTFQFNVPTTSTYTIYIFGTMQADYGKVRFQVDGTTMLSSYDAYAPYRLATGPISIGSKSLTAGNHTIKVTSVGKNTASSNYRFGFDTFKLVSTSVSYVPQIERQPVSQIVDAGKTVTFSTFATGNNLTYQWRKNGVNISGATSSSYSIANVGSTHVANYSVRVSNSAGNVTSTDANLAVETLPSAPYIMEGETYLLGHRQNLYNIDNVYDQDMTGFGSGWSNGGQLRVEGRNNTSVELGMTVDKPGTYYLDLYMTKANDSAIYQVKLDGANIGSPIDLYSANLTTSGRIRYGPYSMPLGIHWVTLTCTGKNAASSGYQLGIDKFELQP